MTVETAAGSAFTFAEYEHRWSLVAADLERLIALGERDLSRLLHLVRGKPLKGGKSLGAVFGYPAELGALLGYPPDRPPIAVQRLARSAVADTVIEHAGEVDAIVELGAGWGLNLFHIWLRGGPDVDYHCLELTDRGVETCRRISGVVNRGPRIYASRFDFHAPQFRSLMQGYRRVLVLTSSAIDKVEILPEQFIDGLLEIAPQVDVMSFEFVDWQLNDGADLPVEVAWEFRKAKLNRNYLPLLQDYEARGRIVIHEVRPRALGRNEALVRWGNS